MPGGEKDWQPNWTMRPGVILEEHMRESHLSKRMVARVLRADVATVEGLLDGTVEITEPIAAGLARLGVSPQFWLNLERNYREGLATGKKDISDE